MLSHHHEWKPNDVDPCDRDVWRSSVRSVMRAASQLLRRSPLMWMTLLHLHVNLNAYDDDDKNKCSGCLKRMSVMF